MTPGPQSKSQVRPAADVEAPGKSPTPSRHSTSLLPISEKNHPLAALGSGAGPHADPDVRVKLRFLWRMSLIFAAYYTCISLFLSVSYGRSYALTVAVALFPVLFRALNRAGWTFVSRVFFLAFTWAYLAYDSLDLGHFICTELMLVPLSTMLFVMFDRSWLRELGAALVFSTYVFLNNDKTRAPWTDVEDDPRLALRIINKAATFAVIRMAIQFALSRHERLTKAVAATNQTLVRTTLANQDLQRDGVAKMRFLTTMSHEMRTPLNAIIGLTDLLARSIHAEDGYSLELVRTIETSSRSLLTIINDVLDFSRADAGYVSIVNADTSVDEVAEDVCRAMFPAAQDKGLELACDVSRLPFPCVTVTDGVRLQQVLTNLVGNAVKFTESGSVVVTASLDQRSKRIWFSVADTGPGIPADELPAIFEPFTQVDQTTTRRFDGTGLGLAISKRMVAAMGGEISATSTEGQGSTFSFSLPLRPPAVAPEPMRSQVQPKRVFVAADLPPTIHGPLVRTLEELRCPVERHSPAAADAAVLSVCSCLERRARALKFPLRRGDVALLVAAASRGAPSHSPTTSSKGGSAFPALAGMRVLVAEDNAVNQKVVQAMLRQIGCEGVTIVGDGQLAVEAYCRSRPHVVIMDCHMPTMDGYSATKAIRALPGGEDVPIIGFTADAFDEARRTALAAGMNTVLTKPCTCEGLQAAVDAAVRAASESRPGTVPGTPGTPRTRASRRG